VVSHSHNPEIDESASASGRADRKPGHSRRKLLTSLIAVLVMGVGVVWGLSGLRQNRTEFVGHINPVSGERCRFTLAADWKRQDGLIDARASGLLDLDTFTAPPPASVRKWITTHLFHSSPVRGDVPAIRLTSMKASAFPGYLQIQAGYPEMAPRPSLPYISSHRHLQIDGCPATMVAASDKQYSGAVLMVYVPKSSIMYIVSGYSTPQDIALINHEMQEVLSSFHVDQGAVPPRGKGEGR
jgi:hypothetical protein